MPGTKKPFSKKRKPVMILGDRTTLSSLQSGPSAILTGLAQLLTPGSAEQPPRARRVTSQLTPQKMAELEQRTLELGRQFASPELAAELARRHDELRGQVSGAGGTAPGTSPELLAKLKATPFALSRAYTDF